MWIKKMAKKHIYIFSFIVAFIAIMLLYICYSLMSKSDNSLNYDLNGIITYIVPLIFVFILYMILNNVEKIKFHKEGLGTGFLLGWPFIAVGGYNLVLLLLNLNKSNRTFPNIKTALYFTLIMLFVGLFEEILFRGIILNNMVDKWGDNKAGVLKAVIVSSLIFGLGHFTNLIVAPNLIIRTLSQIAYTSLHGILFASIYLRCKNIWAVVILHAVYDWMVRLSGTFGTLSKAPVDISIVQGLINIAFAIPFALVGLFLLRRVFIEEISQSSIDIKTM